MKLFLFLINKKVVPEDIQHILFSSETYFINGEDYVLYAYTNNKKYKNIFLKTRIDDFYLIEKEIDKSEYKQLYDKYKSKELKCITYKNYGYSVNIISTDDEYRVCKYDWPDFFQNASPYSFMYIDESHTSLLKNKYQKALSMLGIQSLLYIFNEDMYSLMENHIIEQDLDLIRITPQSIFDEEKNVYVEISLELQSKEFNMFVSKFGKLMKKEV